MSNESRTKNSIKNIIFSFGYQILVLILGFVNRTIFINILGVNYLGISGLFSDILTMLSLADLGFSVALTYSMYRPLAEHDYKCLAGLTNLYKKVYRIIAIAVTIIGLSLVPFLKYLVHLSRPIPHLQWYYILFLANTVASYLVVYKTSILTADQKDYILSKYRGIFSFFQTVFMTLFLWLTHNYTVYLCVQVFFTYAVNFYCSHIAEKTYPFIKEKVELSFSEVKEIFRNLYSVFLYKISGVLLNATDNTLISVLVNTSMVGYYSNYSMIITNVTNLINTLFYSLTASLGNLIVKEKAERRYHVFQMIQSVSVILSTICICGFTFLIQDFIRLWLGKQFVLDNVILITIISNFYLGIILLPVWVYREATGFYQQTKYIMILTAIINLGLSIWWGIMWGVAGIIGASVVARLLTYVWYEPVLLFKEYFGKSSWIYFKGILESIIFTLFLMLAEALSINRFTPHSWTQFFLKAIVVGLMTVILVLLFYAQSPGLQLIKNKFKKEREQI
ncbi:lipopolysaccharide biosynthesis protein [Lactobacillus gallinarum]|uniref:lipopolysaccharide biosynthesis protein n=1 Tax=Lactobacillus gallinarum TaxID=52242 RepID=UPI001957B7A3|nr:oligosaccharide flippase family protein [Lactobacillus gallinarum]MBM6973424.1 oligosaccharide flippase family protein [Lactobacillus gallinarum]